MDDLTARIATLQLDRRALREEGASPEALERNRRALVAAHRACALAQLERRAAGDRS